MELRKVAIPFFLRIDDGLIVTVPKEILSCFARETVMILITDTAVKGLFTGAIADALQREDVQTHLVCIKENTLEAVEEVRGKAGGSRSLLIGMGGGRVLDVTKMAAARAGIPWVSIPTVVSHDGICSPIAVLKDGTGKSQSLGACMPHGLIADLDIIARSPLRSRRAGVGDLVSNLSALADWELAQEHGKEEIDDFAYLLSNSAALSVVKSEKKDVNDRFFLRELLSGLVLSGIAMEIAGTSRPCSGGEHEFSHALDAIGSPALHGEQVAIGTILCSFLRGEDWGAYVDFFKLIGLPVTAAELEIDADTIVQALVKAPETRPERYTILEHMDVDHDKAREAATATGVI
jgi:glycerol-1-phosphate dehydrogenase [NAD(P)+]